MDQQWTAALSIAGTMHWTRGDEDVALVVTTPTPLVYDAGCTDTVQRIKDGELHAEGDFGDITGFVRLRWTGCGQEPSIGFGTGG